MPTYDYECGRCFHRFEKYQSITEAPVRRCPSCGRASAKRLIGGGAALLFKGSGFYITDYRSADYQSRAKADAGAAKPAAAAASGTTAPAAAATPAGKPASAPKSAPPSSASSK